MNNSIIMVPYANCKNMKGGSILTIISDLIFI